MYLIYDTAFYKVETRASFGASKRSYFRWEVYFVMNSTHCSCDTVQSCDVDLWEVHPHCNDSRSHEPDGKKCHVCGGVLPKFNFPTSLSSRDTPHTQISAQNEGWSECLNFFLLGV